MILFHCHLKLMHQAERGCYQGMRRRQGTILMGGQPNTSDVSGAWAHWSLRYHLIRWSHGSPYSFHSRLKCCAARAESGKTEIDVFSLFHVKILPFKNVKTYAWVLVNITLTLVVNSYFAYQSLLRMIKAPFKIYKYFNISSSSVGCNASKLLTLSW